MTRAAAFDVAIIGGGISGLVAAYRLQQSGFRVTVADAGDAPGGVIGSRAQQGYLYETGANSTLDTSPALDQLIDELGLRGERIEAAPVAHRRYVVRDGRLAALPGSPPALFATRAFSSRAKLRLLREPWIAAAPAESEESIAAFVRRRLGEEILDYAVDPFVSGIYAGDPERLSVRAAFPRLYALEQAHGSLIRGLLASRRPDDARQPRRPRRSISFRRGMQALPAALAARLANYRPRIEIATIERREGGGLVALADGQAIDARAIVVAVPAFRAAAIVEALVPAAARALRAIEYAPVAIVASAYRREDVAHDLRGFGFLVPRRERRAILGTLFSSSVFEGRAPPGHVLLTSFVGGQREPAAAALDDGAIAARVSAELEALLDARRCAGVNVVRWPHAIPQYTIGHLDRVAEIDAAIAPHPDLVFCASWRDGVAVGDCVTSAAAVAERVADRLRATHR